MNVLALNGSPHTHGNTAFLLEQVLEGARSGEIVHLNKLSFRGCQGCYACKGTARCALRDDMQGIYEKLQEAEAVVFGSPLFCWDVSSQLKAAMDRLFCFLDANKKGLFPRRKRSAFVICQSNSNENAYRPVLETAAQAMSLLFEPPELLIGTSLGGPEDARARRDLQDRAREIGIRLASH